MKIHGTATYVNLEMGFWGIVDQAGNKWRPAKMPPDLRSEGLEVVVKAKPIEGQVSIFMWGKPIEILEVVDG